MPSSWGLFLVSYSVKFLDVWPHCVNARWNRCQDLNGFSPPPLENWRKPPGHPRTMWMKTIQQDLKSNNLCLNEATGMAQNRPLWRLTSTFGITHSYWWLLEINELIMKYGSVGLYSVSSPNDIKPLYHFLWLFDIFCFVSKLEGLHGKSMSYV